jgi:hypothetical protein
MLTPKEIKAILPDIMEMFVYSVEEVLSSMRSEEYYIDAEAFRELIGVASSATFSKLKKSHILDKAMHPATIGSDRVKYHRWFNIYKQRIETPDIQPSELPKLEKLTTKEIETILPQIMKTAVKVVEMIKKES